MDAVKLKHHLRLINEDNVRYRRCHTRERHQQVITQMRKNADQVSGRDDRLVYRSIHRMNISAVTDIKCHHSAPVLSLPSVL